MGRFPNVYFAEEWAIKQADGVKYLDGKLLSAQKFVDKVTKSNWWDVNCPDSWMGTHSGEEYHEAAGVHRPPRRILTGKIPGTTSMAYTTRMFPYKEKFYPRVELCTEELNPGKLGIEDPWVILHEVAHIMAVGNGDIGHGHWFNTHYLSLVKRWLSGSHADLLQEGYRLFNVKTKIS